MAARYPIALSRPRFGRPGVGDQVLSIRFQANAILYLTNRVTGNIQGTAFQRALYNVHSDAARKIQLGMVEELQKKVKATGRPQRGRNRLALSLLNEKNVEVTASGFTALRPAYLDRSPAALYWRRIEEGDQTLFDSAILFTTDFNVWAGPWRPGGQSSVQGRQRPRKRGRPAGYPHMRMIQHMPDSAWVQNIGPYPAYQFTEGGRRVMRRYDFEAAYIRELRNIGLEPSQSLRSKSR